MPITSVYRVISLRNIEKVGRKFVFCEMEYYLCSVNRQVNPE